MSKHMWERRRTLVAALALSVSGVAIAQDARIVQPGAPGKPGRALNAVEASRIAGTTHSPADTAFMQGMIHHHAQALEMVALVKDHTGNPEVSKAAHHPRISTHVS